MTNMIERVARAICAAQGEMNYDDWRGPRLAVVMGEAVDYQ